MGVKFNTGRVSHRGRNPSQNDATDIFTARHYAGELQQRTVQVAVVADGMGREAAGGEAARLAVKTIRETFVQDEQLDLRRRMVNAIRQASRAIYAEALQTPEYLGMGTTVVMAVIDDGRLYLAHVGDSRAYLIRDQEAYQLTRDHTRVQDQVTAGVLDAEAARNHPERHQVSRRLGQRDGVEVDTAIDEPGDPARQISFVPMYPGDTVLLCTDGLWQELPAEIIEETVGRLRSADQTAARLVEQANKFGGRDNMTAVVLRWPKRFFFIGWIIAILLLLVMPGAVWALGLWQPISPVPLTAIPFTPTTPPSTSAPTAIETPLPTATSTLIDTPVQTEFLNGSTASTPSSIPAPVALGAVPLATPTKRALATATPTRTATFTRTPVPSTPTPLPTASLTAVPPIPFTKTATAWQQASASSIGTLTPTPISPTVTSIPATITAIGTTVGETTTQPSLSVDAIPELLSPPAGENVNIDQRVCFSWGWAGELASDEYFEILIWPKQDRNHLGGHNALETARTPNANGVYKTCFAIAGAAAVSDRSGDYLWSVAIVRLSPQYIIIIEGTERPLTISQRGQNDQRATPVSGTDPKPIPKATQ